MSGMSIFPQEIYDKIIAQCTIVDYDYDYDDWIIPLVPRERIILREQTLRSCSLTCRSWTRYSQRHLFRAIWVELDSKNKDVNERKIISLADILRLNPDLGSLVQILRIDCESAPADPTWVFMALFRKLPNLSALVISSSLLLKTELHSEFYRVLCHYQSIRQIRLHNVDDPNVIIRILSALPNITHLCFNLNTNWINLDPTKLPRMPKHVSRLESLIVNYGFVTNILHHLPSVLSGVHEIIKKGNISLVPARFLVVQTLLPASASLIMRAGPSLRELVILGDHETLPTDKDLTLRHLSGLRRLYYKVSRPPIPLNTIRLLSTINSPLMEEIHLLWTFELEKVTATVWHELDQSLNTPTFANLRLLRITTWDEFPLDTDGFDEFAANHLPQCHSRGIVKYGCTAKLEERLRRWGFVWIDDTEVNYLS